MVLGGSGVGSKSRAQPPRWYLNVLRYPEKSRSLLRAPTWHEASPSIAVASLFDDSKCLNPAKAARQPQAQRRDADKQTEPEDIGDQERQDAAVDLPKRQIIANTVQHKHVDTKPGA